MKKELMAYKKEGDKNMINRWSNIGFLTTRGVY